jgi:hypothetical protein
VKYSVLNGREAILEKVVFELRYRHGFTYLDKCGRLINELTGAHAEWTIDPGNPNPQGASLISLANSCVLNMGTKKMDLALEIPVGGEGLTDESMAQFADQVDHSTIILCDILGLKEFDRIGCRLWYIFPGESQSSSEEWLCSLKCYAVSEKAIQAFGGTKEAVGVSIIIGGDDRNYRVAFNGVERAVSVDLGKAILNVRAKDLSSGQQKLLHDQQRTKARIMRTPTYPAMIDVDAYVEDPEMPACKEFVLSTASGMIDRLKMAIGD